MNPPAFPAAAEAFQELDRSGARWALLHPLGNSSRIDSDIDLLIDAAHRTAVTNALTRQGFVRIPLFALDSQFHYLKYVAEHDCWLWLDISAELRFGPYRCLRIAAEGVCLARAVRGELSEADQFWIQLLHAALDRAELQPRHIERLRELVDASAPNDELGRLIQQSCPACQIARLREYVCRADWSAFSITAGLAVAHVAERYRWRITRRRAALWSKLISRFRTRGLAIQIDGPVGAARQLAEQAGRSAELPLRTLARGTAQVTILAPGPLLRNCLRSRSHTLRGGLVIWLAPEGTRLSRLAVALAGIAHTYCAGPSDSGASHRDIVNAVWQEYARRWSTAVF